VSANFFDNPRDAPGIPIRETGNPILASAPPNFSNQESPPAGSSPAGCSATSICVDLQNPFQKQLFRADRMFVKTHCKGREITGVEIGAGNVQRYFPKEAAVIELLLDHLQIQCGLAPDFWDGETEIRDPRLRVWLESKNFNAKPGEAPVPLALIPTGKNCFRLQPVSALALTRPRPAVESIPPSHRGSSFKPAA
jgi:hypothetical protein